MRWCFLLGGLALTLAAGCGQRAKPEPVPEPAPVPLPLPHPEPRPDPVRPTGVEPGRQAGYDDAMLEAYTHLARGKYTAALTALQAARAIEATPQVLGEIARVQAVLDQQNGAVRAIADIRAVLQDGRADEAATLAAQALALYGTSENAAELAQLKRQADALAAAQANEGNAARAARLHREKESALDPAVNNLRAAVAILEQLDAVDDSPEIDQQLTESRKRLTTYDLARQRATELRAEADTLDEALEQLQIARTAWQTFQVNQEIDEVTRALALRKPRLGIADFEVRGFGDAEDVARSLAEDLLPGFKTRYDLVDRTIVEKVLDDLKLDALEAVGTEAARQELARLVKARYLVVGSLSDVGGYTVRARIVDLQTGLLVQTGRLFGESLPDIRRQLPQLAAILQMNDEEKTTFEEKLAREQAAPKPVVAAVVPPAPEPLPQGQAVPPPIITVTVVPPPLGNLGILDLDKLPPAPLEPVPLVVVREQEDAIKDRLLFLVVEVGDNHFRRGAYGPAYRCYDLALALGGARPELVLRLDRCRPFLPPGFVLIPERPRIAVLNFCTQGRIPPGLDSWTADALLWYLPGTWEAVPRGELFWYMARLNLTARDVVHNPSARRWLGRALGARYFVVGSLRETASFDVTAHLIDAENGWQTSDAWIHVRDAAELKLRVSELSRQLAMSPAERVRLRAEAELARHEAARFAKMASDAERLRLAREANNFHLYIHEARHCSSRERFDLSVDLLLAALRLRPDNIEVQTLLQRDRDQLRQRELREAWKTNSTRHQDVLAEMQRKQADLARAVEEARARAEREAANRAEGERRAKEAERERAYQEILGRARKALDGKRYDLAISLYRDAVDLKPGEEATRGLASARAGRDTERQLAEAEEKQRQERLLREKRERELAALQAQLEAERKQRDLQEQARRAAQVARDREVFAKLLQDARDALAARQAEPALTALATARRMRPDQAVEIDKLWNEALALQQRPDEKAEREKAAETARLNGEKYNKLLVEARKATFDGKYPEAVARYEEALKVFRTDEALTGLQKARDALARETARKADSERLAADMRKLRADGLAAFAARDYVKAKALLTDYNKRVAGDVAVLTALSQTEQALAKGQDDVRREEERKQREADFTRLFTGGKANYDAKQYAPAVLALREAVRLKPDSKEARDLLALAEKAQTSVTEADKLKAERFQKLVTDGRILLGTKQYDKAETALQEARKLFPQDRSIDNYLAEVKKGRDAETARIKAEAAQREADRARLKSVTDSIQAARLALSKKDLDGAAKLIDAAVKLLPDHPDVKKVQQELASARALARTEADALKKRQADHAALLTRAGDALKSDKPEDALKLLAAANEIFPNEPAAQTLRTRAEMAIQAKLKGRIDMLVADARKALGSKDLTRANQLLREARQLAPNDPGVKAALTEFDRISREPTVNPRIKADYDFAMGSGKSALDKKLYQGAVNSYKEALRLIPGDKDALARLAEAERLLADAHKADIKKTVDAAETALRGKKFDEATKLVNDLLRLQPNNPDAVRLVREIKAAEDAGKKEQFTTLVARGKNLLDTKKFAEAVAPLEAALKLFPTDREAQTLLKQAKDGPPAPKPADGFAKFMADGAAAEGRKNFAAASAAYTEALKVKPNDTVARVALQRVQTASAITMQLAVGKAALAAKKWADAEAAYNAVLRLDPRNADGKEGLQKAKARMP